MRSILSLALALALLGAAPLAAQAPPTAPPAAPATTAAPSKPWALNLRYRYEEVDTAAFARDAQAHTVRLRGSYLFQFEQGWSALVEAEGVAELNDRFNSGANNETAYPSVPDARALEINQAYLDWRSPSFSARLGRQAIMLDNQRFFGNVGWRQNTQSFDAVQGQWNPSATWDIRAFYVDRVHRIAGDNHRNPLARERDLDGRLLRVARTLPGGSLVGYGYWVEDQDLARDSFRTLGLRWSSTWALNPLWKAGLALETATQRPWAGVAGGRSSYLLIEPRLEHGPLLFRAGFERLGAGNGRAFQTPLASLHGLHGWSDVIAAAPINGLEDRYLSVQGGFRLLNRAATWHVAGHDFQSDHGVDYGSEWNAQLGMTLRPGLNGLLKAADYRSDGFASDTRKIWLQLEWTH